VFVGLARCVKHGRPRTRLPEPEPLIAPRTRRSLAPFVFCVLLLGEGVELERRHHVGEFVAFEQVLSLLVLARQPPARSGQDLRVSGFGFRVSGFGFRVSGLEVFVGAGTRASSTCRIRAQGSGWQGDGSEAR